MPSDKSDFRVQVVDDEIIVTRTGWHYSVAYYKPENSPAPWLSALRTQTICEFL